MFQLFYKAKKETADEIKAKKETADEIVEFLDSKLRPIIHMDSLVSSLYDYLTHLSANVKKKKKI